MNYFKYLIFLTVFIISTQSFAQSVDVQAGTGGGDILNINSYDPLDTSYHTIMQGSNGYINVDSTRFLIDGFDMFRIVDNLAHLQYTSVGGLYDGFLYPAMNTISFASAAQMQSELSSAMALKEDLSDFTAFQSLSYTSASNLQTSVDSKANFGDLSALAFSSNTGSSGDYIRGNFTAEHFPTTMDSFGDGTTNKVYSAADKTKVSLLSGTNTGDQDLTVLVPKTTTVNGHALSSNVTVTKSDVSLGNVDNTADASKTFTASQVSDSTSVGRSVLTASSAGAARSAIGAGTSTVSLPIAESDVTNLTTDMSKRTQVYVGSTQQTGALVYTSSGTVSGGVIAFNMTNTGFSGGTALCANGPFDSSVNAYVSDSAASYQIAHAWSNSNKTITFTVNKLTTANILTGILGQSTGNGSVVRFTVLCN